MNGTGRVGIVLFRSPGVGEEHSDGGQDQYAIDLHGLGSCFLRFSETERCLRPDPHEIASWVNQIVSYLRRSSNQTPRELASC